MIVVVIGVSGSGKSTIGRRLARRLGWEFRDADEFHSSQNIAKMSRGEPLDDADREPWLKSIRSAMAGWLEEKRNVVLACSALKTSYRDILKKNCEPVVFLYLKGSFELLKRRMAGRKRHFMKVDMLTSQFAALEEPTEDEAIIIDTGLPMDRVLDIAAERVGSYS